MLLIVLGLGMRMMMMRMRMKMRMRRWCFWWWLHFKLLSHALSLYCMDICVYNWKQCQQKNNAKDLESLNEDKLLGFKPIATMRILVISLSFLYISGRVKEISWGFRYIHAIMFEQTHIYKGSNTNELIGRLALLTQMFSTSVNSQYANQCLWCQKPPSKGQFLNTLVV